MPAPIDDSVTLARLADYIVANRHATVTDAMRAAGILDLSVQRRLHRKWKKRREFLILSTARWMSNRVASKTIAPTAGGSLDAAREAAGIAPSGLAVGAAVDERRAFVFDPRDRKSIDRAFDEYTRATLGLPAKAPAAETVAQAPRSFWRRLFGWAV